MKTLAILLVLVVGFWTTGASAQDYGGPWLVGSTAELEAQRDATNALFCLDHPGCAINNPDPSTYSYFGEHPFGLGEVDCKFVTYWEMDYAEQSYQGQSSYLWADLVTDQSALPQVCKDYLFELTCGPAEYRQMFCEAERVPPECCL